MSIRRSDLVIVSFADEGWRELRELTWPRQHAYARRHGYAWEGYTVRQTDRPPSWNKILFIRRALDNYNYVWWIDADAAPANPDVPLPAITADLMMARDSNGYNCGIIGCRASEATRRFWDMVWEQVDCIDHPWWEQAAVHRLIESEPINIDELPKCFNAYPGEPDAVILHCPSLPFSRRIQYLRELPPALPLPLPYSEYKQITPRNIVEMDDAHVALLRGLIMAHKPQRVLELGIGMGKCTRAILEALAYNTQGHLTCVDNWHDWHGQRPLIADTLASCGAKIVEMDQSQFLAGLQPQSYDFIVSDANHFADDANVILSALTVGGIAVFHDTNAPYDFPALQQVLPHVLTLGLSRIHFKDNSRPDERCDRGLLIVSRG